MLQAKEGAFTGRRAALVQFSIAITIGQYHRSNRDWYCRYGKGACAVQNSRFPSAHPATQPRAHVVRRGLWRRLPSPVPDSVYFFHFNTAKMALSQDAQMFDQLRQELSDVRLHFDAWVAEQRRLLAEGKRNHQLTMNEEKGAMRCASPRRTC